MANDDSPGVPRVDAVVALASGDGPFKPVEDGFEEKILPLVRHEGAAYLSGRTKGVKELCDGGEGQRIDDDM